MNYIYLLLFLEVVLFVAAFLGTKRDIMAPSVIFCISFITGTSVAILNFGKWDALDNFGLSSCLILSSGILVVVLVEQIVMRVHFKREISRAGTQSDHAQEPFHAFDIQTWKIIALLVFNVGVTAWYFIEIYNVVLSTGWSGNNFINYYRNVMITDSQEGVFTRTNLFLNQMLKVVDASAYISLYCIIYNILAKKIKDWKNIGLSLICILSEAQHLLVGGRSEILHFIVVALVYYYILWHKKYGWDKSLVKKFILVGLVICVVAMPFFYWLMVAMGRGGSGQAGENMFQHASIYIGSGVALFDQYIKSPVAGATYFGEESLVGITSFLERFGIISQKATGRFLETRFLTQDGALRSNMYSFFRRPYHDFGWVGMLLFTALVALFFAWIYNKRIKQKTERKSWDYWNLAYGYLFYWIFFAGFEQRSVYYLSLNTILIICAILIGFFLMAHVNVTIKNRRIVITRN